MSSMICKGCGSEITPQAGMASCFCEFCGTQNQVAPIAAPKPAQPTDNQAGSSSASGSHKGKAAQCPSCGSQMSFNISLQSVACNFCGHEITLASMTEVNVVDPDFIIPFATSKEEFFDTALEYLVSGDYVPYDVLEKSSIGDAVGIYMPFVQFKGSYKADWNAMVGVNRQEKYWDRDSQGRSVQRTRTVIDWHPRNGRVNGEYALNASASKSLDSDAKLFFEELPVTDSRKFDIRITSGFAQEVLTDAISEVALFRDRVKGRLDEIILENIKSNISGDHVKDIKFTYERNRESTVSYAYPAWLVSYSYEEKPYSIYMDGKSSKNISGLRPKDEKIEQQVQIPFIVSGAALVIAAVLWFLDGMQNYSVSTFSASAVGFLYSFINRTRVLSFGLNLRKKALEAYKQHQTYDIKADIAARSSGLFSDRSLTIYAVILAIAAFSGTLAPRLSGKSEYSMVSSQTESSSSNSTQISTSSVQEISTPISPPSHKTQAPPSLIVAPSQPPYQETVEQGEQQEPVSAQPSSTQNQGSVAYSELVGIHPQDAVKDSRISQKLKSIATGNQYDNFIDNLSVADTTVVSGDYIFGSGCAPHVCSIEEGAFVINTKTGELSAAMLNEGNSLVVLGGQSADSLPEPLNKWYFDQQASQGISQQQQQQIAKPQPIVQQQTAQQPPSQNPESALLDKFINSARDCLAKNKFDCAISKAEAALEVDPNNADAKKIKSKAKAEQDKAFSGDWDAQ